MRFYCLKEFKYWDGDRLVAHYLPGMAYNLVEGRKGHDKLKIMLFGGTLPDGKKAPGWINEGKMTLTPPTNIASGVVSGSGGNQ